MLLRIILNIVSTEIIRSVKKSFHNKNEEILSYNFQDSLKCLERESVFIDSYMGPLFTSSVKNIITILWLILIAFIPITILSITFFYNIGFLIICGIIYLTSWFIIIYYHKNGKIKTIDYLLYSDKLLIKNLDGTINILLFKEIASLHEELKVRQDKYGTTFYKDSYRIYFKDRRYLLGFELKYIGYFSLKSKSKFKIDFYKALISYYE
jgi:hypothetical protein